MELLPTLRVDVIIFVCCHNGRRSALCRGTVTLWLHRNHVNGIYQRRDVITMSLDQCIALLGVVIASVALGYTIGKDIHKKQKWPPFFSSGAIILWLTIWADRLSAAPSICLYYTIYLHICKQNSTYHYEASCQNKTTRYFLFFG